MIKKLLIIIFGISIILNVYFVGQKVYFRIQKNTKTVLSTKTMAGLFTDIYAYCPNDTNEIVFLGNSITSGFMVEEFFPDQRVKNRGVWGDQTIDMLNRLDEVIESKPVKVFILAGINDIVREIPLDETIQNMEKMILRIQSDSPETKIYIQSILPLTRHASQYYFKDSEAAYHKIKIANKRLQQLCAVRNVKYINLSEAFMKDNELNAIYSWDGIHINGRGFLVWYKQITDFVVY
ncbi:MAG: sialate O-acetylesterase [Bacteroidetes bacterium]|nr:sialate O-acetylesterase [Bacteroidota bacterium]